MAYKRPFWKMKRLHRMPRQATMPEIRYTVPASHPYAKYYASQGLMTWHPKGILDDASADQVVEFLESWEKVANVAFSRYVDMSGFSRIQLSLDHIVRLARRR